MPDIPFIICIIVSMALLYDLFFGHKKDFWACLNALLLERRSILSTKSNDERPLRMILFLVLAFVGDVSCG